MKKVLIYNNTYFSLSETFIWEQAKVVSGNFDSLLLGNELQNQEHFDFSGLNVRLVQRADNIVFRYVNKLRRWFNIYSPFEFVEKRDVKRILRSFKPDLVHAHFGYNAVKIMPLLKALNIPLVVSFHGIDASKRIHSQPSYYRRLPSLLEYASRIIVVSPHMIDILNLSESQRKKVQLVPYSVDHKFFETSVNRKTASELVHIVHSGRLVAKKGVPDLVRVFGRLATKFPDIRLHILGAGEEYNYLRQLVEDMAIQEMVTFYGSQPRHFVRSLLELSDIFVLNSREAPNGDMEGTPVSLLEAMSMQSAVVATNHAGIPDVIQDGYNGLLVDERNNDQLYHALHTLIMDPRLRSRLGEMARSSIISRYHTDRVASELTNIYNTVPTVK